MEKYVDTVLTAEDGFAQIYDVKAELSGAQLGSVEVVDRRNGVHYAMRTYKRAELSKRKRAEMCASIAAQRVLADSPEAEDLRMARLVSLHEVVQSPSSLMLMNDVVPRGGDDLLSMIERRGRLAEKNARQLFTKLVLATKRAHDRGVVLRAIKPETVQVALGHETEAHAMADALGPVPYTPSRAAHVAIPFSPPLPAPLPRAFAAPATRALAALATGCVHRQTTFISHFTGGGRGRQVQKDPVDGSLVVCFCDMRCATLVDRDDLEAGTLSGLHGTPEYSAPEEVIWYWHELTPPSDEEARSAMYGAKVDIWSLGMCLHVMLCGCFPFENSDDEDMLRAINAADFSYSDPGWSKLSEDALDMVPFS